MNEDWLTNYLLDPSLNGSTAPNSTAIPLSTPVNTSGGNTNGSGSSLGNFLSGLSSLGTTAANAYATVVGRPPATGTPSTQATAATAAAAGFLAYLPWILTGAGVLLLIVLLTRKR